jgi:hypothetical protein
MGFPNQTVVRFADSIGRSSFHNPEDQVGVVAPVRFCPGVKRANTSVISGSKSENPGDLPQICVLGGAQEPIGEGNMKKPAEEILEHCPIVCKQTTDLPRVALKPGRTPAREIKDQSDMFFFPRRYLKDLAEGRNFVASNGAIGFCHFGAERDHGDGECDPASRIAIGLRARGEPARNEAHCPGQQAAERAAKGQVSGASYETVNKTHHIRVN